MEVLSDMALDSNEKRQVVLKLIPKSEGKIKFHGIRYLLCGIIPSFSPFEKKIKGQSNTDLILTVTPPMPVLECIFHNFPDEMLAGQVSACTIELYNKGGKGLKDLMVLSSMPSMVYYGDATAEVQPNYSNTFFDIVKLCPESGPHQNQVTSVKNNLIQENLIRLQLPVSHDSSYGCLKEGCTSLIPFWIRPESAGKFAIRFLFAYQSSGSTKNYRTLRIAKSVEVTSSLRLSAFIRPSLVNLFEFVIGIEITNTRPSLDLILRQITSISPNWKISLVEERCLLRLT
jgi:hypothetical protein